VGRQPNTASLNLEELGIKTNKEGVVVDKSLRTTVDNIYACGDIVGPYLFSHVSNYEGIIATFNAVLPLPIKRKVDYSNLLWVTYTDPELAHLGLTEAQARAEYGNKIKIYHYDYADLDRAETDSNREGKAKFICDSKHQIIGARAGELIHESQILKNLDQPLTKLSSIMHAYPTYSELNKQVGKEARIKGLQDKFAWLNKLIWWKN
jgi:pyruvate/2-oxoglutarate dehydrogenase complex dihydrolipoamide dehydrogenase (E3) component